ncbi:hypothetical protein [Halomarina pelagica]|uniref:hypothetical protein n=1 Tax=Halomarina pelagica TaxID=2961599 RepID=UPI0020C1C06A|nr:hypothetical protein [Halomarina sp. BND7]
MSVFVICDNCGRGAEFVDEHEARAEGWRNLRIEGVVGPANRSEWNGRCPDCA